MTTRTTPGLSRWIRILPAFFILTILLATQLAAADQDIKIQYNGLTLNANLANAGEKLAGQPVVLIVHGTLAHNKMEIISGLQNALLERDITSLAINLSLGRNDRKGMYDCKSMHRHLHEDALDEISQWLDWLQQQKVKSVAVLGHSRGGNQVAWFAAERMRPELSKIILMAPMTWNAQYAAKSYQKNYGVKLAPLLAKAKTMGDKTMKSVDFIYCPKTDVKAASFVSYYRDDPRKDTPYLLPKIKRPVLVLVAENDKVVKNLAPKIEPLTADGRIKMVEIPEAGHMFLDFALDDAADSIAEFLQ